MVACKMSAESQLSQKYPPDNIHAPPATFTPEGAILCFVPRFIAKYSMLPGGQRKLEAHEDTSDFSFVLALNDLSAYEGSGLGSRVRVCRDHARPHATMS